MPMRRSSADVDHRERGAPGAMAVGAPAIGALAIGQLAIGRARIRRLEIDELVVRRLRIIEPLEVPSDRDTGT